MLEQYHKLLLNNPIQFIAMHSHCPTIFNDEPQLLDSIVVMARNKSIEALLQNEASWAFIDSDPFVSHFKEIQSKLGANTASNQLETVFLSVIRCFESKSLKRILFFRLATILLQININHKFSNSFPIDELSIEKLMQLLNYSKGLSGQDSSPLDPNLLLQEAILQERFSTSSIFIYLQELAIQGNLPDFHSNLIKHFLEFLRFRAADSFTSFKLFFSNKGYVVKARNKSYIIPLTHKYQSSYEVSADETQKVASNSSHNIVALQNVEFREAKFRIEIFQLEGVFYLRLFPEESDRVVMIDIQIKCERIETAPFELELEASDSSILRIRYRYLGQDHQDLVLIPSPSSLK